MSNDNVSSSSQGRLMLLTMELENFKSYAGIKKIVRKQILQINI